MWERSGIGTISFGYCSVLSLRKICLKIVAMPLAIAHHDGVTRAWLMTSPSRAEA
jgi:hypothetical protein